jgi:AAA+ superfamily predicted ATPase
MLDPRLADALSALDTRLLAVCDEEERRAALLAGDGRAGWDGVRNLARPATPTLLHVRGGPGAQSGGLVPPGHPAFDRLAADAGLSGLERDILLVLVAAHVEPRYQALYAVLQDDAGQGRPTERLLFAVLGTTQDRRGELAASQSAAAPLLRSGMVRRLPGSYPPLGRPLELAEEMVAALLGDPDPLVPDALTQLRVPASGQGGGPPVQILHGPGDALGLARSLLSAGAAVLAATIAPGEPAACLAAWRIGLVTGAHPVLDLRGWPEDRVEPIAQQLDTLARDVGGRVWLCTRAPLAYRLPHVEARAPGFAERRRAWLAEASDRGLDLPPAAAGALASAHRLDTPAIREVFASAAAGPAAHLERRLDAEADRFRPVDVPRSLRIDARRTFDDLVLSAATRDALDRLVHFVRRRDHLAEWQGLGRRFPVDRGPLVLFAGRSGTGKTAAAEAVANALGRPLHTVDISQLLSKYIGDSEKHIDEVLSHAQEQTGVLLCDEADALFSSRTEQSQSAGEHFANVLVGYLLQRIERHDGTVILSTNLRDAIDDAFSRRFSFRIEFPMPSPADRLRIWQLMLLPTVPQEDGLNLKRLAERHAVSGGDIANAALRAIFLADREERPLNQNHLDRAIATELLEQGRLSRRPALGTPDGTLGEPDRGQLVRALTDRLEAELTGQLRRRFLKEVHLLHGSPTEQALAGRRPAVSLTLFRLAARRGTRGLRAGFIASTWSALPEEEYELTGVVHEVLTAMDLTELAGRPATMRMQESYDFDLLHKFWSSHDRPVRPSLVFDVEVADAP